MGFWSSFGKVAAQVGLDLGVSAIQIGLKTNPMVGAGVAIATQILTAINTSPTETTEVIAREILIGLQVNVTAERLATLKGIIDEVKAKRQPSG